MLKRRVPLYTPHKALCPSCPFNSQQPVGPELVPRSQRLLTILLEGPGYTEAAVGVPLAGKTGGFMDDVFEHLGLTRQRVSILNAMACLPTYGCSPKDFRRATDACRPRVDNELEALGLQPGQIVLAMGEKAMTSLCGHHTGGITKWRGYPLPALSPVFQHLTIFPTFHPSFVLREPAHWPILKADVRRAVALQDGEIKLTDWPEPKITIGNSHDTYAELVALHKSALDQGTSIGLDIETGGTNWLEAPLLCIGVADNQSAISIPASHDDQVDAALRALLADAKVGKVLQNRNVDLLGLRCAGYEVSEHSPLNFDLLDAARIAFPDVDHDLGALASYFLFRPRWKSHYHAGKDKGENTWLKDAQDPTKFLAMQRYNALDAHRTILLEPYVRRALEKATYGP